MKVANLGKIRATISSFLKESNDVLLPMAEEMKLKLTNQFVFEAVPEGSFNLRNFVSSLAERLDRFGIKEITSFSPMAIRFNSGLQLSFSALENDSFRIKFNMTKTKGLFERKSYYDMSDDMNEASASVDKAGTLTDTLLEGFRKIGVVVPEIETPEYQKVFDVVEKSMKHIASSGVKGSKGSPLRLVHMGAAAPVAFFLSSIYKQLPMSEGELIQELMRFKSYFTGAKAFPYSSFNLMKGAGFLEGDEQSLNVGSNIILDLMEVFAIMGLPSKRLRA